MNNQRSANYIMTAVKTDIAYPTCLQVQSDIGNGLNLRENDDLAAPLVGILTNGSRVYQHSAPSSISNDLTGRLWLFLQRDNQENVWASLAEKEGAHVNFRLCS